MPTQSGRSDALADDAPGRRDPEATQRAIIAAACAILVEQGASALTHRAVAARAGVAVGSTTRYFDSIEDLRASALRALADELAQGLAEIEEGLAEGGDLVKTLTSMMGEFLSDEHQVRATIALIGAATDDPELREVAVGWSDGLGAILSTHVGRGPAAALVVYLDGATVHTALRGTPPEEATLHSVVEAVLTMPGAD
ncbi:TetR family transcriptional regulator [Intrasporangium sp.]|uniref:TetR/AcrR family transcriptional regulator n=1 Tax=Intrasporangium sp. TaxID=1925024 RepID=UPI003221492F